MTAPSSLSPPLTPSDAGAVLQRLGDLTNTIIADAFFQELALKASEDPSPPTAEEQEDIDAIAAFVGQLARGHPERQKT